MFNNCSDSFNDIMGKSFGEFVSDIEIDLENRNKDFKKMHDEISEIMNKYPKLRSVYEDEEANDLSKKECNALIQIWNNKIKLKYLVYEEMFYRGNVEAYYYLKKIGLLKEKRE